MSFQTSGDVISFKDYRLKVSLKLVKSIKPDYI